LPSDNSNQLQQEFSQYLSNEVLSFASIERSALEKIIKVIFPKMKFYKGTLWIILNV